MEDVKFFKALAKGDIFTKLSVIILGLGNLVRGQIIKGLIFLGIEAAYIYYLINSVNRRRKYGMKRRGYMSIPQAIILCSCSFMVSLPLL